MANFLNKIYFNSSSKSFLQKELFEGSNATPKIGEPLSEKTRQLIYYVGDIPTAHRSGMDILGTHHLANQFTPIEYHAFGFISAANAPLGVAETVMDYDKMRYSQKIGDKRGEIINTFSFIKGLPLVTTGVSYLVFRVLSILHNVHKHHFPTLLGRVNIASSFIGSVAYLVYFALFCVIFAVPLYEGISLKRKLAKAKNLEEKAELLRRKITVDVEKFKQRIDGKTLEKEGKELAKANLKGILKELNIEASDEKIDETVLKLSTEKERLQAGLHRRIQILQTKKEGKLSRILMKSGMEDIKALKGRVTEKERDELVQKVASSANKKIAESAYAVAIYILGVAAMVVAFGALTGVGILLGAILMFSFSVTMGVLDAHFLLQSYNDERLSSKYDKKMVILSTALAILSFSTVAILGGLGVVSMGIAPLIISSALALFWLGMNGATWHVLNRGERLFKEKNPCLKYLKEALEKGESIEKMQKNLSVELKELIGDVVNLETVSAAMKKVERIKEERLEALRKELMPYFFHA